MKSYLVDTNILSELMRRGPNPQVARWAEKQSAFIISVVTVEEVLFGLTLKSLPLKQRWFDEFSIAHCQTLPVTEKISRTAGLLRGQLGVKGQVRTASDMLIAATALCHELPLATRNVGDFLGCGLELLNPFDL